MKKNISIKKYLLVILLLLIICSVIVGAVYYLKYGKYKDENGNISKGEITVYEDEKNPNNNIDKKEVQIFRGNDRVIAVMIDNEEPAWPHSGLDNAYMIYEAIIEGGETRLMALFKGKSIDKIGPIRSARHYFVEYAMEHNAIYTHYGCSPKAESMIKSNSVNNINGITADTKIFYRIGGGYHNVYTGMKNILQLATEKKYLTTSTDKPLYTIKAEDFDLADGKSISDIYIKYSNLHNVSYKYDANRKVFLRSMRGRKDIDRETSNQYYAKNIIIIKANNYTINDGENKGRQEIEIVGTGTGYYITNGKYINITWKKDNAKSKTYIYNSIGQEIILNDGITYFQIVPLGENVEFTSAEEVS